MSPLTENPVENPVRVESVNRFIADLDLIDVDLDGPNVAALVDYLIENYGEAWEAELDQIKNEAKGLISGGKVYEAMLYLGKKVNEVVAAAGLDIVDADCFHVSKDEFNGERMILNGGIPGSLVPSWWTEMEGRAGLYSGVATQLMNNAPLRF
ncbi:MAG: hypothetical protein WCT46_04215 [Candidatus Gracilibacteria bacterium]